MVSVTRGVDQLVLIGQDIFVGYQFWGLRFDYSDDEVDFDTNRIYAGVELRM